MSVGPVGAIRAAYSTLSGVFAFLIEILDAVFVNEQVGTAATRQLDTIAVVPFDAASQNFAVRQDDRHGSSRLHLFHIVEIFGVRLFWRRGFLALRALGSSALRRTRGELLLYVRESRAEKLTIYHEDSLDSLLPYDCSMSVWVAVFLQNYQFA